MLKRFSMMFLAVLLLFSLSMAQTDIGLKGVGGKLGYIMPDNDVDNMIGFGLIADLGKYNDNIGVGAYVDYFGKTYDSAPTIEVKTSVISIAAIGKYFFESNGNFVPYAGGGLGLDIGKGEVKYTGESYPGVNLNDFSSSSSNTELAIHLVGGAQMELSPDLTGIAEVKYTIGDLDYFGIYVGVIYALER